MNKNILIFIFIFFAASYSWAGTTYWISPTGAAADLAACSGETPLNGTAACSYDKANGSGVAEGDTVYYRAGTYNISSGNAIHPYNTGSTGKVITFTSYDNEDVQFVNTNTTATNMRAVQLHRGTDGSPTETNYIKVYDLHFTNFYGHLWILKSKYNEVSNCTFTGMPTGLTVDDWSDYAYNASYIYRGAQYNWIHDNKFSKWGWNQTAGHDNGGVFMVGVETGLDNTSYNLIENNEMFAGAHHTAEVGGTYNVWRNNYIHNEPWWPYETPVYSTRVMITTGAAGDGRYNLVENNRIGYGGPKNKTEIGGAGICFQGGQYGIWRYNTIAQIYTDALYFTSYVGQDTNLYNHIYNNTFWHGGYGMYQTSTGIEPSNSWNDRYAHPAVFMIDGDTVANNVLKNNIFYQNRDPLGTQYSIIYHYYDNGWKTTVPQNQILANNWLDNSGDPKFIDISAIADPSIDPSTQWDFRLQSASGALNAGAHLTQANGASEGASTTLIVDDASYFFYDIGDIASAWPSSNVGNDYICVGTVNNCSQISTINYSTNTITLSSALTWEDDAPVYLYKKSDGTRVLYGTAPDMGAHERATVKFTGNICIGGGGIYD